MTLPITGAWLHSFIPGRE